MFNSFRQALKAKHCVQLTQQGGSFKEGIVQLPYENLARLLRIVG